MLLHLTVPKYHCSRCNRYFRHRFKGLRPRLSATKCFRLEVFEAHEGGVTQSKLSYTNHISHATVERWYQFHIGSIASQLTAYLRWQLPGHLVLVSGFALIKALQA